MCSEVCDDGMNVTIMMVSADQRPCCFRISLSMLKHGVPIERSMPMSSVEKGLRV